MQGIATETNIYIRAWCYLVFKKKKKYYDTVYILEENANFLKKRLGTLEGIIKVATKLKSVSNPINCLCQTCELSVNLFQYFIFSYTETGNTD